MIDGNFLVHEASRLGKPFVFVTLNYRLGYYGFLTSRELQMEAKAKGEDYSPNPGLHDQRLALRWVRTLLPGGRFLLILLRSGSGEHCTLWGRSFKSYNCRSIGGSVVGTESPYH